MIAYDMSEGAYSAPELETDGHPGAIQERRLGFELVLLLDHRDEERAGGSREEVQGGETGKFDRVVVDDPKRRGAQSQSGRAEYKLTDSEESIECYPLPRTPLE